MRRKRVVDQDPLDVSTRQAGTAPVPNVPCYAVLRSDGTRVEYVSLETRELHVLGEKDFGRFGDYGEAEGSVVWFQPPAGSTDEEVALERARLFKCGAARVKPLAREQGVQPVAASALEAEAPAALGLRELVAAMVDEVEPGIREPVRGVVELALSRAGI